MQAPPLPQILKTTRSMLDAARAADWQRVEALASVRDPSLRAYLVAAGAWDAAAASQDTLAEIERINAQIVALLAPDVTALENELGRLRHGRRAAAAYAAAGR